MSEKWPDDIQLLQDVLEACRNGIAAILAADARWILLSSPHPQETPNPVVARVTETPHIKGYELYPIDYAALT